MTKSTTRKKTKKAAPAPHVDYLTIRSGLKDFSQVMLNDYHIQSGEGPCFYMSAYMNTFDKDINGYSAKLLFQNIYSIYSDNILKNMKSDLQSKILAPAKEAGRLPVIVICANHLGGGAWPWSASPALMSFLHQLGAGPKLSDLNQKFTQLGSYDMSGIGYILVTKYGYDEIKKENKYFEVFEASDINLHPSASLSLQMVQVEVNLPDNKTNSFMTLQDNT